MSYELLKPYTDTQYADFVCEHQGLQTYENETAFYFLEANEIVVDGEIIIDTEYEQKLAQQRQADFDKDFFNTSLGYIRRKVSMKTGETKDFLSDLLPTIKIAVEAGQNVPMFVYAQPDFTQEITEETMLELQSVAYANAQFIQECLLQVSVDMFGLVPQTEEVDNAV